MSSEDNVSALRERFAEYELLAWDAEHVGHKNRMLTLAHDIAQRLIALGNGTHRELLALLQHPEAAVRLAVARLIGRFDPALSVATIERLTAEPGRLGSEAHMALSFARLLQTAEWTPPPPIDPERRRIVDWQIDHPPPRSPTRAQFEDRVRSEFAPGRASPIIALARPAIGLCEQRAVPGIDPSASRHYGDVVAPRGWSWPIYEQEPLYFLGQIRLAELAGVPGAELLPADGLLAFFGDFDVIAGCFPGGDAEQGRVYHWPTDGLFPAEPPLPLIEAPEERRATPLVFRSFIDLPDPVADIVAALQLSGDETERYWALREDLRCHGIPLGARQYCDVGSKLFGWPDLVQTDFGLPSEGLEAWRLLAQLPARMGPGGWIYFFIRDRDLAEQRFDRCIIDEQNT